MTSTRPLVGCVARWPGCAAGEYDPRCCRFPKSCSCTVYDPEAIGDGDLEPAPEPISPKPTPSLETARAESIANLETLIEWTEQDGDGTGEFFRYDGYVLMVDDLRRAAAALRAECAAESVETAEYRSSPVLPEHAPDRWNLPAISDACEAVQDAIRCTTSGDSATVAGGALLRLLDALGVVVRKPPRQPRSDRLLGMGVGELDDWIVAEREAGQEPVLPLDEIQEVHADHDRALCRIDDLTAEIERLREEAERAWAVAGGGRCRCGQVATLTADGRLTDHAGPSGTPELCDASGTREHEPPNLTIRREAPDGR